MVHVIFWHGYYGAADSAETKRQHAQLLRDTFLFLLRWAGCCAHHDLGGLLTPLLSLAVLSANDVGGWADCAAVAEVSALGFSATCFVHMMGLGSRIDAVLANCVVKHPLCEGVETYLHEQKICKGNISRTSYSRTFYDTQMATANCVHPHAQLEHA